MRLKVFHPVAASVAATCLVAQLWLLGGLALVFRDLGPPALGCPGHPQKEDAPGLMRAPSKVGQEESIEAATECKIANSAHELLTWQAEISVMRAMPSTPGGGGRQPRAATVQGEAEARKQQGCRDAHVADPCLRGMALRQV